MMSTSGAAEARSILSHIRPVHMEPNSVSFCMKVRQIATTLLPDNDTGDMSTDVASSGAGAGEDMAASYLRSFLEILTDLEKSGTPGTGTHRASWHQHVGAADSLAQLQGAAIAASGGVGIGDDGMGEEEDEEEEAELRRWGGLREQQREVVARSTA